MALRSAPAQKDFSPAPVSTTARMSRSFSAASEASPIATVTARSIALRAAGRLIVITSVCASRVSTTGSVGSSVISAFFLSPSNWHTVQRISSSRDMSGVQLGESVQTPRAVLNAQTAVFHAAEGERVTTVPRGC